MEDFSWLERQVFGSPSVNKVETSFQMRFCRVNVCSNESVNLEAGQFAKRVVRMKILSSKAERAMSAHMQNGWKDGTQTTSCKGCGVKRV